MSLLLETKNPIKLVQNKDEGREALFLYRFFQETL